MAHAIFVPIVLFVGALVTSACRSPSPPPGAPPGPAGGTTSPCAAVLCPPDTVCEVQADGSPRCVQPNAPGACFKTGCSGTVCADEPVITTCEYRPEFACYQNAICERDPASGICQFRPTAELVACLEGNR